MARREPDPPRDNDPLKGGLKHNPFAALKPKSGEGGVTPADETRAPQANSAPSPQNTSERGGATQDSPNSRAAREPQRARPPAARPVRAAERVTVRRERSGRGGKTVTIAEGPGLAGRDLEALAREIARGLGAGARVEGGSIVVQGEQPDRLVAWLAAHGFASVDRGN
jgi:translation initiation factor 1 (eIF-1/SUI1)